MVLGQALSGVKWGGRKEILQTSKSKIRRLDVSFNRFTVTRQGEWPAKTERFAPMVPLLPDLLPLLHRFEEGVDPAEIEEVGVSAKQVRGRVLQKGELDGFRKELTELASAMEAELKYGRYGGSAIAMLGALSDKSNEPLEWVNMSGHVFSEEGTGVLAYISGRMQRESTFAYSRSIKRGNTVSIKATRSVRFPRSAKTVAGCQVGTVFEFIGVNSPSQLSKRVLPLEN